MANSTDIGSRIKKLRQKKGMSQADLALYLDVNQTQISHLENNRYEPGIRQLKILKRVLETTYDYLLDGSRKKPNVEQMLSKVK